MHNALELITFGGGGSVGSSNYFRRILRLSSGLVLFAYITMHLANHSLGQGTICGISNIISSYHHGLIFSRTERRALSTRA